MQPDFITIGVHVSHGGMSAYLSLNPVEGAAIGELTADDLNGALHSAGVIRGIDMPALSEIAADWNGNPRSLKTAPVAKGKEAVPEKPGTLRISVRYLTSPGDIITAQSRKYYWEVASLAHKFQRVDHGAVIAKRAPGIPSIVGYDVYGAPKIAEDEGIVASESEGIHERNNVYIAGHIYTAACTGIVYADGDDEPGIIPLNFDGVVALQIAPDKMSAELAAFPAGEGGDMPTEEFIRTLLKKNGVVSGINEEELANFLVRFSKKEIDSMATITVADGLTAIKGDDGWVEFCFNTESSPTPLINPDGSADYKTINIVTSVAPGTVLAILHPPSKGTPGKDITGRALPALNGQPAILPVGANTVIPKENPATLIASTSGIVRYDGAAVNISEGYAIQGDVSFSTGNINYDNSVTVGGDIKSGFDVKCGGDLQVNGIIEDCNVVVKGNVLCRYGFVGRGKGVIEAHGDINLGYMKNQTLISKGIVNIAKEAINCNITARKGINIYGHSLSAAGGTLISNGSIVVKTVGNISSIITTLQIAPQPELIEEIARAQTDIEQHEINIKKLTKSLDTMPQAQKNDKELVRKVKNAIIVMKQQITTLEDRRRLLNIIVNKFENAFIRIDRCAYPGTVIKFGQYTMSVSEMLTGKTIRMINQEIKVL